MRGVWVSDRPVREGGDYIAHVAHLAARIVIDEARAWYSAELFLAADCPKQTAARSWAMTFGMLGGGLRGGGGWLTDARRPDYKKLSILKNLFPNVPILAVVRVSISAGLILLR